MKNLLPCPDCGHDVSHATRRGFLRSAATAVLATPTLSAVARSEPAKSSPTSESLVKVLYDSLKEPQKKVMCLPWDYKDSRGLLRTHISNNWLISKAIVKSNFFTMEQQDIIRKIFEGLVQPDWIGRFDKQFKDDLGGFGRNQAVALFGTPGTEQFEFVLSGRHGTIRCDGNSEPNVCFGGPIVYGHAASGYYEKYNHPGNVFWHQAEAATKLYEMLDGKQQKLALLDKHAPDEAQIAFRGTKSPIEGLPVTEMSKDQKQHLQEILRLLIEPYRQTDRDEVLQALKAQGGLDKCHLVYYGKDDWGDDKVWDNWRLEGPAFVWHYRGLPHVHVWVNVASSAEVITNSKNLSGPLRPKE